jgi:hypothetical protein
VNTKQKAALLLIGIVGTVLLWPDGEAPDTTDPAEKQQARQDPSQVSPQRDDVRFRPQDNQVRGPEQQYGPADRYPLSDSAYPSFRQSAPDFPGQRADRPPAYRPLRPQQDPMERFTFRPLSERERQRLEAERPDTYFGGQDLAGPSSPYDYSRQAGSEQPWYQQPYAYPEWQRVPGYGYGPGTSPSWGAGGRGGDYRNDRRTDERTDERWSAPDEPQWGSQPYDWAPPAQRMYPSLNGDPGRRLTAY